jgi:hypothetical protein
VVYAMVFMLGAAAGYLLNCFMAGAREVGGELESGAPRKAEGCGGNCKCKTNNEV